MEDRFRLEFHFHELFAIVYLDLFSKHLGHDDHVPQVSPDLFIPGPEPGKEVLLAAVRPRFILRRARDGITGRRSLIPIVWSSSIRKP